MATGEPFQNLNPLTSMIDLTDDRLSFTFPEIARQLRAHVGRQIGHILTGAQRRIEKMSS
jgi:tetrahydromethanopterin S-methyltransferase subunit G